MEKIEIKVSNNIDFENKGNPRITVGGGGNNMVSYFARKFQEERKDINKNIKLIAINTDLQALSIVDDKNITLIQIGKKTARGLGELVENQHLKIIKMHFLSLFIIIFNLIFKGLYENF